MMQAMRLRDLSRRTLGLASLVLCACAAQEGGVAAARQGSPSDLYRRGEYEAAITAARAELDRDAGAVAARNVLVRALRDVGQTAQALSAAQAGGRAFSLLSAELLSALGRPTEGESALREGLRTRDSLSARVELARLALLRGARDSALAVFDGFIDVYNAGGTALAATDVRAVARAVKELGRRDPQLFKDAMRAYDEAIARDSLDLDTRVELGELFLEKFNGPDARGLLEGVLALNARHPRALVALARLDAFDGRPTAGTHLRKAIEVHPGLPAAHAMLALQLIDVEQYAEAVVEARKGLIHDSLASEPWTAIAAARYLQGDRDGYGQAMRSAHVHRQASADPEVVVAEILARNRLYREAAEVAEFGVERDDRSARSLALSGINRMRVGAMEQGTRMLTRAFEIDPYDVWVKNTLDLIDTFKDYAEVRSSRFVISAERKDSALVALLVAPLAEEAYDSLAARYGFRPPPPVRVELYRSSADFSVRTVGLAGLGALGVSFGGVVAMDAPGARKLGEFNWGSTLWHELAHTFTLGATDNRIPRWLSEGLSVLEERRARSSWGRDISPSLIAAYEAGRLHPVSRLNDGFVRPRYPEELTLSYALASFVAEMIDETRGAEGLRRLLAGYRSGRTSTQLFGELAGGDAQAFDRSFDAWFRKRFAGRFSAVEAEPAPPSSGRGGDDEHALIKWQGPLADIMISAEGAVKAGRVAEAITRYRAAQALFPEWADEGSAYARLAEAAIRSGDTAQAVAALTDLADRNETAFAENVLLARLLREGGKNAEALAALRRTLYMSPTDIAVHDSTASLAATLGAHSARVTARRAVLALNPTDRVQAHFELALALADAGDQDGARREVLRALDLAPNFEKAQDLLLKLRRPEDR